MHKENDVPLRAYAEKVRPFLRGKALHALVGAVVSIGMTWAVLHGVHWKEVRAAFRGFPIERSLIALVPLGMSMLMRSTRWHVLLRGERCSLRQVFLTQNTGIGLNNLLPVRMVSEPVQLAMITVRYRVPFPVAVASLLAGNVMDILATTTLLVVGVSLTPDLRGAFGAILIGGVGLAAVTMLAFFVAARGLSSLPFAKGVHFFHQLTTAIAMQRRRPVRLALSYFATVGHWLFVGLAAWLIARGMGMDVSPIAMATIMAATTFFVSAVPSLPGAVGTFEAAMVFILGRVGIDSGTALSFALVLHALVFLPASTIALIMISRLGVSIIFRSTGQQHGLLSGVTPSGAACDTPEKQPITR